MKKVILSILIASVIVLGESEIYAQTSLTKSTPCHQSAKEILSEISTVYDLSPASDKVLIAGEVRGSLFLAREKPYWLTEAIAIVGGVSSIAGNSVYLLRHTADSETQTVLEVNINEIKTGRAKDHLLENGDVVFVPKRCSSGKAMPFTDAPKKIFRLKAAPIPVPNTLFSQKRSKGN
jgi:hypothetical protein